jgi:hypothetical protein
LNGWRLFLVKNGNNRRNCAIRDPHPAMIKEQTARGIAAAKYVLKVPFIAPTSSVMLNSPDMIVSGMKIVASYVNRTTPWLSARLSRAASSCISAVPRYWRWSTRTCSSLRARRTRSKSAVTSSSASLCRGEFASFVRCATAGKTSSSVSLTLSLQVGS